MANCGIIDNLGTGHLYGDHLALQAQTHAAAIAARQRLDIGATTLRNTTNAFITSDGDEGIDITAVRLTPP
ncbi:hypothetical protein XFHB_13990 [Xylella fastidiosa]|uniref:Uncharacterized protein n=1 Tax=Xylella fastidiosa TaxID=2371 RepID=A0ABD7BYE7_XYLFS|nr:hypothetical protein XFHB_13990 [Xylella fastidiosa]